MKQVRNLILDMDGVLWRGDTPMPGLTEFFETLHDLSLGYVLATNNATRLATQYSEKLARFGVDVPAERILTSAEATAAYLSDQYSPGATAYVVGEDGLEQAMRSRGFAVTAGETITDGNERMDLVVVGFNRHACYAELASAAFLVHHGARFIGTNPDVSFPSEIGPLPGAGSLIAFIEAATGRKAEIIGKPNRAIFDAALKRLGAEASATAMVGDRLETDIAGAKAAGLKSILLLSGITGPEKAASATVRADIICDDITALGSTLREWHG